MYSFCPSWKRQRTPRIFANSSSLPAWKDALLQSALSKGLHEECLHKEESDGYLLPAFGRGLLQSDEVEGPTVAFQPLTVALWGVTARDGSHHVTVPLGRGSGGAD